MLTTTTRGKWLKICLNIYEMLNYYIPAVSFMHMASALCEMRINYIYIQIS